MKIYVIGIAIALTIMPALADNDSTDAETKTPSDTQKAQEIWGMTCNPRGQPPFVVAANLSTEMLAWRGDDGKIKGGPIIWKRFEFHGITVIAKGTDVNIKAHFNPAGGSLTFLGGHQSKIKCGPAKSTEVDQSEDDRG